MAQFVVRVPLWTVLVGATVFVLAACAPAAAPAPAAPAKQAEPAKPATESAKPAAQPAKPAAEPAKPAAAAPKPAAQPAKPAAPAKVQKILVANALNPGDPTVDVMTDFKKEVEEKSGGQLQVELYPSAQLGSQEQVVEMVKSGAAHIHIASPQYPAKYMPELQVITLPYLFATPEAADKALEGPVGAEMNKTLEQKTEFTIIAWEEFGFKNVFNRRRPINTMEDLKGLKLRVIDAPVPLRTFQALGASPIGLAFNEVYTAIQTGVIDGAEIPFTVIRSSKGYEVAKYISATGHFYEIALAYANKSWLNGLPPELRKVVVDAAASMAKKEKQISRAGQKTARDSMASQGAVINDLAPAEIAKMQAAVRPVYDYAKQQWGEALINKVLEAAKQ